MPELGTRYKKQAAGTRGEVPGLKGWAESNRGAPRVTVLHPRLPFRSEGFIPPKAGRAANADTAVSLLWALLWLKRVTDP